MWAGRAGVTAGRGLPALLRKELAGAHDEEVFVDAAGTERRVRCRAGTRSLAMGFAEAIAIFAGSGSCVRADHAEGSRKGSFFNDMDGAASGTVAASRRESYRSVGFLLCSESRHRIKPRGAPGRQQTR